jgi:hypothetical protein
LHIFRYLLGEVSSPDPSESLALALLLMGENQRCSQLRLTQETVSSLCTQGWSHLQLRAAARAYECFDKALKLSPSDFEANLGIAKVQLFFFLNSTLKFKTIISQFDRFTRRAKKWTRRWTF